ncbi:ParB/RepB/Spo0J family partition protein [Vibrio profundum]|uniref:ParB/RepB/Spo0J family partition protein n=1 Tax=Vibrio profundum TaxID=2910247 RepID=UPI003D1449A9
MSKRGLGKGLDALLATSSLAREKQQVASQSQALSSDGELIELSIGQLRPGVYQPRKDMSADALHELSASIQSQGIIQPIVVRQLEDGHYEIIAGERRWRAARHAGLKQVPCLVKNVTDRAAVAIALIENIQREDLNVIEESQALERLQNEFSLTHQQVADAIGKSRTTVTNLLRLNQLQELVKDLLVEKKLEMGHARALLMLNDEQQQEVAEQVASKHLTVRQTERLVKKCLSPQTEEKKGIQDQETHQMSESLAKLLGVKVSIVRTSKGGTKMTLNVDEPHKFEEILARLQG